MKIGIMPSPYSPIQLKKLLQPYGHEVLLGPSSDCDFFFFQSASQAAQVNEVNKMYPNIPMIAYNWDIYEWVWTRPRTGEYNYKLFGEMLKKCVEVWCPSQCTVKRTKEWFDIDTGVVIKSPITWFEHEVKDGGYAYCSLRSIPDRHVDWFEKACKELNIPYKWSKHDLSYEEFQKNLAECRFTVAHYFEASTGGLSLLEGYYLGKPALVSNSEYMGARDYLGDRATYFQWDDYEDFKKQLKLMWEKTPKVPKDHKEYVMKNFSEDVIGSQIKNRLLELKRRLS